MKPTPTIKSFFLFAFLIAAILGITYQFHPRGWRKLIVLGSPPPTFAGAVAYDKNSDYALFFGGIAKKRVGFTSKADWSSDTWMWNGSWHWIKTAHTPPAREKHVLAYDETRDVIVMFGGSANKVVFNDTWEWNGNDWNEKKPSHSPSARCCFAMSYDPIHQGVILYGGWNGKDTFFDDTWLWNGADWTRLPYNAPQMSGHALVQYPPENTVISIQTSELGTWALKSEDGWTNLNIQTPPSRPDGRGAYGQGNIVYFGGWKDPVMLNDTWVFSDNSWRKLQLPISPSARGAHILFYDEKRESFILFGGLGSDYLNDTWELKPSEYLQTLPSDDP